MSNRSLPVKTHVRIGAVDLGVRSPHFKLSFGVAVPIHAEIVTPVAEWGGCDDEFEVNPDGVWWADVTDPRREKPRGVISGQTYLFRVDYPTRFYVTVSRLHFRFNEDGSACLRDVHIDTTTDLPGAIEECEQWGGEVTYHDPDFEQVVSGERKPPLTPLPADPLNQADCKVLIALSLLDKRSRGRLVADKAGYDYDYTRQILSRLGRSHLVDNPSRKGYSLTDLGRAALTQCDISH